MFLGIVEVGGADRGKIIRVSMQFALVQLDNVADWVGGHNTDLCDKEAEFGGGLDTQCAWIYCGS